MMGRQHLHHNILWSPLILLYLVIFLKLPAYCLLSIPVAIFVYSFNDVDQPSSPKMWRIIKSLWIVLIFITPILAIASLGHFGYEIAKHKSTLQDNLTYILISLGIIVFFGILYKFKNTKYGAFLWAHRGFTHTWILPTIFTAIYLVLTKMIPNLTEWKQIAAYLGSIISLGFAVGILGHDWLDVNTKEGIPFFWPIPIIGLNLKTKKPVKVHLLPTKTSNLNYPDRTDPSSKIVTYLFMLIYFILILCILWSYNKEFLELFKF